ncbi:related to putative tartrate transporter [Cephalotrichum gorgonifer]|uniref:Related to putative tartrate transporter n=1 Tax=Cephalotrichum gorgonifer TaxID=2041049 RepID=A0AAE8N4G9_9PEZI|nr:related to putative tartrate transporter [Cephalotrichum gorgonifer]
MTDTGREDKEVGSVGAGSSQAASESASRKRLLRKSDMLVMPGLAIAYFTHTLDRANLGNAKTDGLEADLGLKGNQYSLLLVLFYVPYALFNIPWTIAAKRFNPSVIIPAAVAIWGICTLAAAATKNFGGIMATRIVMGAVEAAYKPCEVYYLSLFYTRKEMGVRVSIIGQMGFIAGAVSGLISWSVFRWTGGLHGWQYLFLIEGSITVAGAIFLFAFAPRSVEKSGWYTEEEKTLAKKRLEEDTEEKDKQFRWSDAKAQLLHGPTWAFAFLALMYGVGVASSSNFLPSLIKRLTKDTVTANLYTIGPNLVASVIQITATWTSDRTQHRASIAAGTVLVSLLGWVLLGTLDLVAKPAVGYFLTFLITGFTFIPSNIVPVWLASNVPTTTGRAVALGLNYAAMNLAGIFSSLAFRAQDAPVYKPALITSGVTQGVFVVASLALRQYYVRLNKKLDSGELVCAPGMEGRPEYRYAI